MTETGWFLGSTVIVCSLLLHCAARPYEDGLIDWCELFSLLSTLFIFQAGLVFKTLNDPEKPQTTDAAATVKWWLEWISLALTVANVFLATFIELRVWIHVRDGEEDYRVRMLKRQVEESKLEMEALVAGVSKAKALADERMAHRAAIHGTEASTMGFDNPVADSDDDSEVGEGKKESKQVKKDSKKSKK
eukprot:COSAG02_NODE_15733_length_1145_cov_1.732314_1_plen_190_part_00